MKVFRAYCINPDDSITIVDYPCTHWEVSCILVSNVNGNAAVEFKRYDAKGNQILDRVWCAHFELLTPFYTITEPHKEPFTITL